MFRSLSHHRRARARNRIAAAAALLFLGPLPALAADESCNVFYPLTEGASWTYREGLLHGAPRVEKIVTVRSAQGGSKTRTAVLEQSVRTPGSPGAAAGRGQTTVKCDEGQIRLTIRGVAQGTDGGSTAKGTVVAEIPGLPPARKLVPGYTWNSKSTIRATDDAAVSVTEGIRKNRVAGRETVTVPAGRFENALKVVSVETLEQKGATRTARQEFVEWYVENVGLVMRETRVKTVDQAATSVEVLVKSNLVPPS